MQVQRCRQVLAVVLLEVLALLPTLLFDQDALEVVLRVALLLLLLVQGLPSVLSSAQEVAVGSSAHPLLRFLFCRLQLHSVGARE